MGYKLWIDDVRPAPDNTWRVADHALEAMKITVKEAPEFISFDHDLGEGMSGLDVAKCLVDRDITALANGFKYLPDNFAFAVHSANPVGKENIEKYLGNYLAQRRVEWI